MRKILLLNFILLSNLIVYSQSGWISQSSNTNDWLSSVYFIGNTGYATGQGTILKTINGGIEWSQIYFNNTMYLTSVYFINADTGYAVGTCNTCLGGLILKTINGGITWNTNQTKDTIDFLYSSFFIDSIGYVGGYDNKGKGTILKTIDGGNNWTKVYTSSSSIGIVAAVFFVSTEIGYASRWDGIVIKTTNGGLTWTEQIGVYNTGESLYFVNADTGYVVGSQIYKTVNGGDTWTEPIPPISYNYLRSVYFINADTGFAVGYKGTILKTINGGEKWITQISGTNNGLNSIFFTDANTGYIVGENGTILKTINGGISTKRSKMNENLKIYPNPNNGSFTIEFNNPNHNALQINISDIKGGKILETSCDEEIYYYNSSLLAGIYFVTILGDNIYYTNKIIVK